ncbi:hypothetical protein VXJ25_08030 [Olsenella sp. YH-ols2223]|uniref:Uncharacterized protein n=1 Tax=Olsenella absiana TaxID=3115222 RepID=A0ABU7RBJ1_9ACTN
MSERAIDIAETREKLGSQNPGTRATGILELVRRGIDDPTLVEPLTTDPEPFMFGMPVLVMANAYMQLIGRATYEGLYAGMVDAAAEDLRKEWHAYER